MNRSLTVIVTIINLLVQQTHSLRIKYETCRKLAAKAYSDPYMYITVDPCDTPSFCDYISDDLYEIVDESQGLTIEAGSWADTNDLDIDITIAPSLYDSSIDCLYYDESKVITQSQVLEFSYNAADDDSCGCHAEGRTTLCYDCYIWLCSEDQPLLCLTSDTDTNEEYTNTADDFCDRETTDLTHDATICNMIDLNNLIDDEDDVLLYGDGVGSNELSAGILWKEQVSYLVMIHLDSTERIIYSDIFDNDGNQIVSGHIVVSIEGDEENELDDVELVVQKVKSGDFNHNEYAISTILWSFIAMITTM